MNAYEKLTKKHRVFLDALVGKCVWNATDAYKIAYPKASYKTCQVNGCRLRNAEHMKEAIKYLADQVDEDYIVSELGKLSKNADKDSSKIQALTVLSDIKGLRKSQNTVQQVTVVNDNQLDNLRSKLRNRLNKDIVDNNIESQVIDTKEDTDTSTSDSISDT